MNIFAWLISLALVALPILVNAIAHKYLGREFNLQRSVIVIPVICGLIYPISRSLPEPHITDESITLAQHFVGGGFISTLYFVYLIQQLRVKLPNFAYLLLLYPFVSMMGVTNELLEFATTKLGIYAVDGTDTWWDLLANTLGAYTLLAVILLVFKLLHKPLSNERIPSSKNK